MERRRNSADVIGVQRPLTIFQHVRGLVPRCEYEFKVLPSSLQLRGKTYTHRIQMSSIRTLFLVPQNNRAGSYFVIGIDPPIAQGNTQYNYLVFSFRQQDKTAVEIDMTEDELQRTFKGRLQQTQYCLANKVISYMIHVLSNREILKPVKFFKNPKKEYVDSVDCNYKVKSGSLTLLRDGIIFLPSPPVFVSFQDVKTIRFDMDETCLTKFFALVINAISGGTLRFTNIPKYMYQQVAEVLLITHDLPIDGDRDTILSEIKISQQARKRRDKNSSTSKRAVTSSTESDDEMKGSNEPNLDENFGFEDDTTDTPESSSDDESIDGTVAVIPMTSSDPCILSPRSSDHDSCDSEADSIYSYHDPGSGDHYSKKYRPGADPVVLLTEGEGRQAKSKPARQSIQKENSKLKKFSKLLKSIQRKKLKLQNLKHKPAETSTKSLGRGKIRVLSEIPKERSNPSNKSHYLPEHLQPLPGQSPSKSSPKLDNCGSNLNDLEESFHQESFLNTEKYVAGGQPSVQKIRMPLDFLLPSKPMEHTSTPIPLFIPFDNTKPVTIKNVPVIDLDAAEVDTADADHLRQLIPPPAISSPKQSMSKSNGYANFEQYRASSFYSSFQKKKDLNARKNIAAPKSVVFNTSTPALSNSQNKNKEPKLYPYQLSLPPRISNERNKGAYHNSNWSNTNKNLMNDFRSGSQINKNDNHFSSLPCFPQKNRNQNSNKNQWGKSASLAPRRTSRNQNHNSSWSRKDAFDFDGRYSHRLLPSRPSHSHGSFTSTSGSGASIAPSVNSTVKNVPNGSQTQVYSSNTNPWPAQKQNPTTARIGKYPMSQVNSSRVNSNNWRKPTPTPPRNNFSWNLNLLNPNCFDFPRPSPNPFDLPGPSQRNFSNNNFPTPQIPLPFTTNRFPVPQIGSTFTNSIPSYNYNSQLPNGIRGRQAAYGNLASSIPTRVSFNGSYRPIPAPVDNLQSEREQALNVLSRAQQYMKDRSLNNKK